MRASLSDIFAHERWKTTIMLKRGQHYRVTAHGQWSGGTDAGKNRLVCGPEGMIIPDGDHQGEWEWFLEGRVNGKYPFAIGARARIHCRGRRATRSADAPLVDLRQRRLNQCFGATYPHRHTVTSLFFDARTEFVDGSPALLVTRVQPNSTANDF